MIKKKQKQKSTDMKKTITKQVVFDQSEWNIIDEAMKSEKISNTSIFLRRAILLYIGKNIQQKIKI